MKNMSLVDYVNLFGEREPQKVRFDEGSNTFTMNLSQMSRFTELVNQNEEVSLKVNKDNELLYLLTSTDDEEVTINVDPQYHTTTDKDTKVWTEKVGDYSFKLIYHRDKDGKKEYRLYLAQKVNGKLKRTRVINDDIKKIHGSEKKMTTYFKETILPKYQTKVG